MLGALVTTGLEPPHQPGLESRAPLPTIASAVPSARPLPAKRACAEPLAGLGFDTSCQKSLDASGGRLPGSVNDAGGEVSITPHRRLPSHQFSLMASLDSLCRAAHHGGSLLVFRLHEASRPRQRWCRRVPQMASLLFSFDEPMHRAAPLRPWAPWLRHCLQAHTRKTGLRQLRLV